MEVETDSPIFFKLPKLFEEVKTASPKLYKPHIYTLFVSRNGLSGVIQETLCSSQNRPSKVIQASYAIYASQNGLSELLQASYTLCGSQNGLSKHLQALCGSEKGLS